MMDANIDGIVFIVICTCIAVMLLDTYWDKPDDGDWWCV